MRSPAFCLLTAFVAFAPTAGLCRAQDPQVLTRGQNVCLMGAALAERMQNHGWLETRLQDRFRAQEISVRNLGFGADELDVHQRTMNFGKFSTDTMESDLANKRFVPWDRFLDHCDADVIYAFFGYNESFADFAGVRDYRANLESFIDHIGSQNYNGSGPAELVLFSSIPYENFGNTNLPNGDETNQRIELYNMAMASVARAKGVRVVDIYAPMAARYAATEAPMTINGIHLNEEGNRQLAEVIDQALWGDRQAAAMPAEQETTMRAAILVKNKMWFNRYRATDGYNVYGGRSKKVYVGAADGVPYSNFEVLQRELDHLDGLCANRDQQIWALAEGKPHVIDDSNVIPLLTVASNKLGAGEEGRHVYTPAQDTAEQITAAPGMRVELFADENQFPELVNPVQMAWDTRGRLWVACWETYPHWQPDQPMNDKLLILEDTDGDGRANTCTVFADDLHNPTGIEFWNGGVLLGAAPDLLFLKDTDGDDRADFTEHLLHGLSSADTHHGANSFVLGPDGALYFQEGTFHQSQVESIYGPVRNRNGCVWRFNPRTWQVERYIPYNYANPHGHVFDRWGQDFMTDGTGNVNYYVAPFSGFLPEPLKHSSYFPFFPQRSRPAGGTEILSSAHFPEENQGNYLIANVIGFRGIFQYKVKDDGSGFSADEVEPIVQSSDLNFRPVDLEVGPDGALYFLDWHNAIIGHLQHHLRDPSRDALHGRVYRVTYEGRELVKPALIAGQPIAALLELLKSSDDRTRYRTRIELSGRDSGEVVRAARVWVEELDKTDPEFEHHQLEALWLCQQHNHMDRYILINVLRSQDPRARAAATRVIRNSRHLANDALGLLRILASDGDPRVRLETVVAASFFHGAEAVNVALEVLKQPTDKFIDYALKETMRALESDWKAALQAGESIAHENPAGLEYLLGRVPPDQLKLLPHTDKVLRAMLTHGGVPSDDRKGAIMELSANAGGAPVPRILLWAIYTVDLGQDAGARNTIADLSALLSEVTASGEEAPRAGLVALAENSVKEITRSVGYAAWISHDGHIRAAWPSALQSPKRMLGFVGSAEFIPDPALRGLMAPQLRMLMFNPPKEMESTGAGTGLSVGFYEPAPRNAKRATFAALSPGTELTTDHFHLDLAPARQSDSFGLQFRGTLFAPASGDYTFSTSSDDGSRLYIGDTCVVDNDGGHSLATKSGGIYLTQGAHPILVTYFESGGGEGLSVRWSGPNFAEQELPSSALGTAQDSRVRQSAARAMAHTPGEPDQKLADAAGLLKEDHFLRASLNLIASVPPAERDGAAILAVLDALLLHLAKLPPEAHTSELVTGAIAVARELAGSLPLPMDAGVAESIAGRLDAMGGASIVINTLPHQMLYDLSEFWVEAGKPVAITFVNDDMMPHNLVITIPGALAAVGQAAEMLLGDSAGALQYVPETESILWHTGLVLPGQSEVLTFIAPEQAGDRPYVCTYPGHWRVMNGVMHVVPAGAETPRVTRRQAEISNAPMRKFVRDWTLDELLPLLGTGWEENATASRGEPLFTAAGCIKCHSVNGVDACAGPDLGQVGDKFQGAGLLEHILSPSKEILEDYRFFIFEVEGQSDVIGRILTEDAENLHIVPTLLEPENVVMVPKDKIVERFDTGLSPMPTGMLVTLNEQDILDLLLFLQNKKKQ